MPKLKTITLTMRKLPYKNYEGTYEYKAIDDNGKAIATRMEILSCKGGTFICAFVTKNRNHKFPYTIKHLFTRFDRIASAKPTKLMRPYAIAVIDEYKEAFQKWRDDPQSIVLDEINSKIT